MANLSVEQQVELKQRLEQRRTQLQAEIREELIHSEEEHYIDLAGRVHDEGEQSVADLLSDFKIAIIDRQLAELREIEAAIKRMAMGSYGYCVDCGAEISSERLKAYPTAKRDITCQEIFERTYAQEGSPTL
jgi:RNA polymerase-binding protein DksA